MIHHKIRRTSSNSVNSINKQNLANISFVRTGKQMFNVDNNIANINLNQLYLDEKSACRNYRVIMTINPYCSNVLFNTCTEIIKDEGSDNVVAVTKDNFVRCDDAIGKNNNLSLVDMIRNTEYSREDIGFEYHPGTDIFNNHILRNKSYRIVNRTNTKHSSIFNTISDTFRLDDGTVLKKCCRLDVDDTTMTSKHLYNADDILTFGNGDAINENLKEDNGWLGFYNTSTIEAKDKNGDSLDISRVINNKGNCEFIDMYPDRSLFSFEPKYNAFRGRCEYNWDICLTYPFENTVTDESGNSITVVQDGTYNGLYILDAKYILTASGTKAVQFRTLTKHNLDSNSIVRILYNENENNGWNTIDKDFRVYSLGDMNGKNLEYYFTISDTDLLESIFCQPKDGESYTSWDYVRDYFYANFDDVDKSCIIEFDSTKTDYTYHEIITYNGKYYVCTNNTPDSNLRFTIERNFTLLSEFANEYSSSGLNEMPTGNECYINVDGTYYTLFNHDTQQSFIETCQDITCDEFIMQIINNAFRNDDNDFNYDDNQEDYQSTTNTLWSDYITFRMVRMDGDIPCSYYVRKFKKLPFDGNNELYRLAYATTIYGDGVAQITYTDTINIEGLTDNKSRDLSEMYLTIIKTNRGYKNWYCGGDKTSSDVEYSHCFGPITCGFDYFTTSDDNLELRTKRKYCYDVKSIYNDGSDGTNMNLKSSNITIDDDWFYGDVVEFNPSNYTETNLCDINFRFNTGQREYGVSSDEYAFIYDDITRDDYEGEFTVTEYNPTLQPKHEGYYYKPHYRIRLRGEGDVKQATNRALFVSKAVPYQNNGMFIKLTTNIKHRLMQGDKLVLIQISTGYSWYLDVVDCPSEYIVIFNKVDRNSTNYIDWVTICNGINDGSLKIKAYNNEIPSYASKIFTDTYIWRDTVQLSEENVDLDLTYANNALYIDQSINLYLKRQNNDGSMTNFDKEIDGLMKDIDGLKDDINESNNYIQSENNQC